MGLGMIATPAFQPEYFGHHQTDSGIWLVFMGALLALGSTVLLLNEGISQGRRIFAVGSDSLDLDLALADFRRAVLAPSFYVLLEEHDEVTLGWRLQQQLREGA